MYKRKLKIYFQPKTDFLDDFLLNGSLCRVRLTISAINGHFYVHSESKSITYSVLVSI